MKIALSIDSACDIPQEIIKNNNIFVMPYFIMLGDRECVDGEISQKEIYDYVKQTGILPKTGAVGVEQFKEYFQNILKSYDEVIHITLSSKMTSSTSNAIEASASIPNVHIVDSKSLSSGIGLVALACLDKIKEGKNVDTIVKELEEIIPKVQASFLVDTLKFLYKGGRCSALSSLMATLLKIKPKISVIDGKMEVTKKYLGNINSSLIKYVNDTLAGNNPDKKRAFVTHSSPMEISPKIVELLKEYGFEEVYDCLASSTISSHCGPNTLGILFVNN